MLHESKKARKRRKEGKVEAWNPHNVFRSLRSLEFGGVGRGVQAGKSRNGIQGYVLKDLEFHASQRVLYPGCNEGF